MNRRLWRVFYTEPRAEFKIEAGLREAGVEVFVPRITVIRQWSDRKKRVTEPILRNYLFAHVHEVERIQVLQVPGIVRCLAFSGKLVAMRADEIRRLELLQHAGPHLDSVTGFLPPSQPVVVSHGPMKGLRGEITEYRGRRLVAVRIDSIRLSVALVLPVDWIRSEGQVDR